MKQKIALLGYGAIGKAVHRLLLSHAGQVEVVAILVPLVKAFLNTPKA